LIENPKTGNLRRSRNLALLMTSRFDSVRAPSIDSAITRRHHHPLPSRRVVEGNAAVHPIPLQCGANDPSATPPQNAFPPPRNILSSPSLCVTPPQKNSIFHCLS
jgi:hypothetical protein